MNIEFNYNIVRNNNNQYIYHDLQDNADEITKTQLKITNLTMIILKTIFKTLGFSDLASNCHKCNQGLNWLKIKNHVYSDEFQKILSEDFQELLNNPTNIACFLNSCRSIINLINIPLTIALKNNILSNVITTILKIESKNLANKSLYLKIPENYAKLDEAFKKELSPSASSNEKRKLLIEKVSAALDIALDTIKMISTKFYPNLSIYLIIASSLTKAYIIYLEETNTPITEFLNILKVQSNLIINTHLNLISNALEEKVNANVLTRADKNENFITIRYKILFYYNLIGTLKNDEITVALLDYKETINKLLLVFEIKFDAFNKDVEKLIETFNPIIDYRKNLEKTGIKLLQEHRVFLNEQLDKLHFVLNDYKNKINKNDFYYYIEPEFKEAITGLNQDIDKNAKNLQEFTRNQKYDFVPFVCLSLDEQIKFFEKILLETQVKKQEITLLVKNVCREV